MEKEKEIYEALIDLVYNKLCCLDKVNTCEMAEVIDMIKDMAEACYYMASAEAMEKGGCQVTQIVSPTPTTVVE